TIVMVISGFIGRYIYTAVPRTLDGAEIGLRELEDQIGRADRQLRAVSNNRVPQGALALATGAPQRGWMLVLGRNVLRWQQQRRLRRALQDLGSDGNKQAAQLEM